MAKYAIADTVPSECTWIVAGKKYRAREDIRHSGGFFFTDENGKECFAAWEESAHLMKGSFRRVEE
jgi:hypothetical protein